MWICIVPCRDHTSKALSYGTHSQGISQFYLHTPRTSANKMNHTCLCISSRSWYSFTDPERWKAELALGRPSVFAVLQSPDPVSGITCHWPCVHHLAHSDSFKAHWRQYCFVQPTGHDLTLSWLFRPVRTARYTYWLTYLLSSVSVWKHVTLRQIVSPIHHIICHIKPSLSSTSRDCV